MLRRLKNIKWKRGGGEMLGFAICVPLVILLICAIMSAGYVSSSNQKLTYAAYCISRAACVSDSPERATLRAEAVFKDIYGDKADDIKFIYVTDVEEVPKLERNHVYVIIKLLGPSWKKGTLIRCTTYQYLTPLVPFSDSLHSQSITMMIENAPSEYSDDTD